MAQVQQVQMPFYGSRAPAGDVVRVMSGAALRGVGIPSVQGLGFADLSTADTQNILSTGSAMVAGAAVGGAVTGFAAASDLRGAGTGALLSGGLSGLFTAYVLIGSNRAAMGAAFGAVGLAGVSAAIWMAVKRRR